MKSVRGFERRKQPAKAAVGFGVLLLGAVVGVMLAVSGPAVAAAVGVAVAVATLVFQVATWVWFDTGGPG